MTRQAGIWIDHRQAVLVRINEDRAHTETVESELETRLSNSRGPRDTAAQEKSRDRKLRRELASYYEGIIARLSDIDVLLILGPGEAKTELLKAISESPMAPDLVTRYESADNMTRPQLIAHIKAHFGLETRKTGRKKA